MTSTQNDNALRGIVWAAIYMACTAMIVTLALGMFLLWTEPAAAAEWLYTDSGRFMINGYDGVIEMRDNFGNNMTLNANCAKLIESSGIESLLDVNTFSGTDIYFEECMK